MDTEPGKPIVVYSTAWCSDCHRAKKVLDQFGVNYQWVDIDEHPEVVDLVLRINQGFRTVPTILFPDGSILVEPSNRLLADKLKQMGGTEIH